MNDLVLASKAADWYKLKTLVLDSVSSPITRRVYNMALNEFLDWFRQAPRPGFSKATVSAWRASLEARGLGSSSIIIRMSAIRKLAGEAVDNGLLAQSLIERGDIVDRTLRDLAAVPRVRDYFGNVAPEHL
jgi:site-specific recombinase XerC